MSNRTLSQRNVLLGITGSIAAYKACHLVRKLTARGAAVRVIMTSNARRLLSEAAIACLSGNEVLTEQFSFGTTTLAHHVVLSEWADVLIVAPATANIIGKAAAGIGDDLLSTTILTSLPQVVFAPAMHSSMYTNPIVQENITKLRAAGCQFIGPAEGALASGAEGIGRLAAPDVVLSRLETILSQRG